MNQEQVITYEQYVEFVNPFEIYKWEEYIKFVKTTGM